MKRMVMCFLLCILFLLTGCTQDASEDIMINVDMQMNGMSTAFSNAIVAMSAGGQHTYNGLDDLLADCNVVVEARITDVNNTWSKRVKSDRYTCEIVHEYSSNLDTKSLEDGFFYLYETSLLDAWKPGESYIFFLRGGTNVTWRHFQYTPVCAEGFWGEKAKNDEIQLYYKAWDKTLQWSGSISTLQDCVDAYVVDAPLALRQFENVLEAAEYADDAILAEIVDIVDDNNVYTRNYTYRVCDVLKKSDASGFTEGAEFMDIGPYQEQAKVGDRIVILYETKNGNHGFDFSYDYSYILDEKLIEEVVTYFSEIK